MVHRESQTLKFWDRSRLLTKRNNDYRKFVSDFMGLLLKADISANDITTQSLIPEKNNAIGIVIAKEKGIVAGIEEIMIICKDLKTKNLKNDGDFVKNGDIVLELRGKTRKILERERTYLNLLQRMSGIATLTSSLQGKIQNKVKIAATRKTLWGSLDKKAVSIGGGLTHRLNLSDGMLIKDNHLKLLNYNFEKALKLAKNKSEYIEIEVEDRFQAIAAAKAIKKFFGKRHLAIMLDKINPEEIKSIISCLKRQNLYDNILFEASGNINQENYTKYIESGADIISMGCLTNSSKALNFSLEI